MHWEKANDCDVGRLARFCDSRPLNDRPHEWFYGILTAVIEYKSKHSGDTRYECQHGGTQCVELEEFLHCEVQRVGLTTADYDH
jgi:hypothetical protein